MVVWVGLVGVVLILVVVGSWTCRTCVFIGGGGAGVMVMIMVRVHVGLVRDWRVVVVGGDVAEGGVYLGC